MLVMFRYGLCAEVGDLFLDLSYLAEGGGCMGKRGECRKEASMFTL